MTEKPVTATERVAIFKTSGFVSSRRFRHVRSVTSSLSRAVSKKPKSSLTAFHSRQQQIHNFRKLFTVYVSRPISFFDLKK
jgi:hypothetical protein